MTRVTRQRTTTRVPAQRISPLDQPLRDYTTLPDSPMRQRPAVDAVRDTVITPPAEQTLVLTTVHETPPPSEVERPAQSTSGADPAEIRFWRRCSAQMFKVLLPPRWRTYQGGISNLPAPSLWDREHDTDDWPDQEVRRPRHGRLVEADPDGDTPRSLPVAHVRDAALALHTAPPVDSAEMMRRADEAAQANDDRIARFAAETDAWFGGFADAVQDLKARLDATKAKADAAEIARRVAVEDAQHPAACDTMAAGMVESAKLHADLHAMLAKNPAVSA